MNNAENVIYYLSKENNNEFEGVFNFLNHFHIYKLTFLLC